MKKIKLQKLLKALSPEIAEVDFSEFDNAMAKLKSDLKQNIQVKTLEDVNGKLEKFKKEIDLKPLREAVESIRKQYDYSLEQLREELGVVLADLGNTLSEELENSKNTLQGNTGEITKSLSELQQAIKVLSKEKEDQINNLNSLVSKLQDYSTQFVDNLSSLRDDYYTLSSKKADLVELNKKEQALLNILTEYKREWNSRFSSLQMGGGNANRDITIGGNSSTLSKYTDINFKPGSGVTLTYVNNDTTKKLDVTITATGTGSGVTRAISTLSVSSVITAVANTDRVLIANQGIQLTLPTAVSDTNLYTIKNVSASSVLVAGTGGETIDGDPSIILATQFTSVDLISDGANWNIT